MITKNGEKIRKILSQDIIKALSWGIYNFVDSEDGLQFSVNGVKFKGDVCIKYYPKMDRYNIHFRKPNGETAMMPSLGVEAETLVDIIDERVEYSNETEYSKQVMKEYNLF